MKPRRTLEEKAVFFRSLHQGSGAFLIPNPWDMGTARILERLGYQALATTSAGFAFSLGKRDYEVGREAVLGHIAQIAAATDLPVSADLENGFGDTPECVAATIRDAGGTGIVGGSIEDATGNALHPIYDRELAVERVRAAAAAARSLPFPFTLTARCENFLHVKRDLGETIERLQAYQEAGADVLFAPGLKTETEIAAVVASIDRPLNVLAGMSGFSLTQASLSRLGVKRISVGGALAKAALGAFVRGSEEMRLSGSFTFVDAGLSTKEANAFFEP